MQAHTYTLFKYPLGKPLEAKRLEELLTFSMKSTSGVKCDLILAVRSQILNTCVKPFTDMPWSTCSRLVQKKKGKHFFFFVRKCLAIIDLFEGLWSVGTRFRH